MRLWIVRPAVALALLMVLAGPALAWTEFRLSGLEPGQLYTLRITEGAEFSPWKQSGLRELKVKPSEASFIATGRGATLLAALKVTNDTVLGTLTPGEQVKGEISARGFKGTIRDGVWFIALPGAPPTCRANPSCPHRALSARAEVLRLAGQVLLLLAGPGTALAWPGAVVA